MLFGTSILYRIICFSYLLIYNALYFDWYCIFPDIILVNYIKHCLFLISEGSKIRHSKNHKNPNLRPTNVCQTVNLVPDFVKIIITRYGYCLEIIQ